MTRFIEADYYTYPNFRKEFYLIEGGDCRRLPEHGIHPILPRGRTCVFPLS